MGVLGVVAALGAVACTPPSANPGGALDPTAASTEFRGQVPTEPARLPGQTLTDTDGKPYRLAATTPVTVLFFGYTHCPSACSTALADVALALRQSRDDVRRKVRVVFVTVDPERDTPARIRDYLDRFDPAFEGLTGEQDELSKIAGELGVVLSGKRDVAGSYQVGHGAQLIGFDAAGERRVIWPEGTPVADLAHDLDALVRE